MEPTPTSPMCAGMPRRSAKSKAVPEPAPDPVPVAHTFEPCGCRKGQIRDWASLDKQASLVRCTIVRDGGQRQAAILWLTAHEAECLTCQVVQPIYIHSPSLVRLVPWEHEEGAAPSKPGNMAGSKLSLEHRLQGLLAMPSFLQHECCYKPDDGHGPSKVARDLGSVCLFSSASSKLDHTVVVAALPASRKQHLREGGPCEKTLDRGVICRRASPQSRRDGQRCYWTVEFDMWAQPARLPDSSGAAWEEKTHKYNPKVRTTVC